MTAPDNKFCNIILNFRKKKFKHDIKKYIFVRFCLCIFESDSVIKDCPMQKNYEIFKD